MSAPAIDREKLVRVLGMLGSAHDGEVAAAGRAADKLVRESGLRWGDVVLSPLAPSTREIASNEDAVDFCIDHPHELTSWEFKFVWSLYHQRYPLTQKQRQTLAGIVEKIRRAEARAA